MTSIERLIYMANQIAANFATEADPVAATANHIRLYWDPRMKALVAQHRAQGLSPTAASAVDQLANA